MYRHNHVTRDIKEYGKCPACDDYLDGPTCGSCLRRLKYAPGWNCTQPDMHTAVPKNHGGVGKSPA